MPLQTVLLSALAMVAGAAIAFQLPINAAAGARLGHPLGGATLSFLAGSAFLIVLSLATVRNQISVASAASLEPVLYVGGLLGALYVVITIALVPYLGASAVIVLSIAGQVVAGLLLDHYGALGLVTHHVTFGRALGAVLVVAGAMMVKYF